MKKAVTGLTHCTAHALIFGDQPVVLSRDELRRVLREVADTAPDLLHEALEDRVIRRTAQAVAVQLRESD